MGHSMPRIVESGGRKKDLGVRCFVLKMKINSQGLRLDLWYVVSGVIRFSKNGKAALVSKHLLSLTKLFELELFHSEAPFSELCQCFKA